MSNVTVPDGFTLRRDGLVVPRHVESAVGASKDDAAALDPDGRRRVVITADEARLVKRTLRMLEQHGFTVIIRCNEHRRSQRIGVPPACGELLQPEDLGTHDNGFGCTCSRMHMAR